MGKTIDKLRKTAKNKILISKSIYHHINEYKIIINLQAILN